MSDEKIDLAAFDVDGLICLYLPREQMDKWVRAVRAARTLVYSSMDDVQTCAYFDALDEALAPFTDSAEVRNG